MSTITDFVSMKNRRDAFMALAAHFQVCSDGERQRLIQGWPFDAKWEYPSPWTLAWPDDSGYSSEARMLASLICDCLEGGKGDIRDVILGLAIVYNSAILAEIDPNALFARIIVIAPSNMGSVIKSFVSSPDASKSMKAFMLKVIKDPQGRAKLEIED